MELVQVAGEREEGLTDLKAPGTTLDRGARF